MDSEAKNESDVVNPNTEKVTKHTARLSTSSSEPQMPNGNHNSGAQEEPPANEIDDALREAIEIGNPLPLKKLFADMRFTWEFGVKHLISKLDQVEFPWSHQVSASFSTKMYRLLLVEKN